MIPGAPKTFRELLAKWMSADAQMVNSFNEAHIDDAPTSEAMAKFNEVRNANMATALATALQMLAQGEDDGK